MTDALHTIVAAVDGSSRGADAFAFAVRLAQSTGARVVAASVYAYRPPWGRLGSGDAAREAARAAAATATHARVHCDVRIVPAATPAAGIASIARTEHASLVVLGSRHRGRLGEALPGQVGHALLRAPEWPLAFVARDEPVRPLRHIAVLAGNDEDAERALALGQRLAAWTGAELRVHRATASAAEELAAGRLDVLVAPDWPHGLMGRLRRRGRPARRPVGHCVLLIAPPVRVAGAAAP